MSLGAGLALLAGCLIAPAGQAADSDVLAVDFSVRTGDFRGGATGTLYGFGDEGAPTQALINGAHITNTSQKAPYGTQHPSGDALRVEGNFFAEHGEDMYIYVQDYYPDWPYAAGTRVGDERTYDQATRAYTAGGNGIWDYLEVVEFVTEAVATTSEHPQEYIFIPFNEPDGIWYQNWSTMKDQFLTDWDAVHAKIQQVYERHGLGKATIGGPGDSRWHADRSRDLLAHAKQAGNLPDVFVWHELGIDNLATYRSNYAAYRALEDELGVSRREINITEYGMLRDMGVPGQLIQWFSMFEDTKVDAQTAYWNYAGNFSDNSARPNGANAGWWMFKWYGDLAGAETVKVTPPALNSADTLQGIGAVDEADRRATVLWGGGSRDVTVDLSSLDTAVFGDRVDVEVREIALTGAEGLANTPRVVKAIDGASLVDGRLSLTVGTYDRYAGYQLIVTPDQDRDVEADAMAQPWTASIEAEAMDLTDASVYTQDPQADGGWKFLASHGQDVGSFNRPTSRADWTIEVPEDGLYRFQAIGGAPGVPGRHALFVDGSTAATIQYTADLALNARSKWQYRGSAEVVVPLTAGTHTLSVRASRNGTSVLPNSDITLDKVILTSVGKGERTQYPASTFRLRDGAGTTGSTGGADISESGRADVYATAMDSGYYDVAVDWDSTEATTVGMRVNGSSSVTFTAEGAGSWRSTARVHLAEGINELEISSAGFATVRGVDTTRVRDADDAAISIEAESARLAGTAAAVTLAESTGSNVSGGSYVGDLGNGAANAIEIDRAPGFDSAGDYDVTVHYSNAELSAAHDYNPQVVDRRLDVSEAGQQVGHAYFRYTYAWDSFWQRTIPVHLDTADQPLRLGNADAYAPNVDRVVVAPRVLGEPTTKPGAAVLDVTATASTRCAAGKTVVTVTVANGEDGPVTLDVTSAYGAKHVQALAPGKQASYAFSTRQAALPAGVVDVAAVGAGEASSVSLEAAFAARDCG